jgi:hypothetical protein
MKNIRIILITAVSTFILSIGFSASAMFIFTSPQSTGPSNNTPSTPVISSPKSSENNTSSKLSATDQISRGYVYDIYTGVKLDIQLSPTEIRFRNIEARLSALEAKK